MFEKIKENEVITAIIVAGAAVLTYATIKAFGAELSEELQEVVEEVTEANN